MGRCTVTKGQRQLGRKIRKLENSVELSSKEGKAKLEEQKYKQKTQTTQGYAEDSAVQNLRDLAKWKKQETKT
jgi:DNA primase